MAVATGLLIAAGITAAANAYAAHEASSAGESAAKDQAKAARSSTQRSDISTAAALNLLNQAQASNNAAYAPYRDLGTSGMSALRSTLNLPDVPAPAMNTNLSMDALKLSPGSNATGSNAPPMGIGARI